jgi:FAD:protein FMN transferase
MKMPEPNAKSLHVEPVMGTIVSLDIRGSRAVDREIAEAIRWLHQVDATFSTYRPESVIRRLDRGDLASGEVGDDVAWILNRCEGLRRETDGWFDARAGGRLDPSALVKGWAVQHVADCLIMAGLTDFCLTAGGDVVTRGHPVVGQSWRVGIQHPSDRGALAAVVIAEDLAVATSGAYERGPHIIDPATGAAPRGVLSVTVCGNDLATADAYATAAFAMGRDGAQWTLGLRPYEALTILEDGVVLTTPGFPELLAGASL